MKKKKKIKWKTLIPIYAMMLPGLIYLLINNYAPMFGLVIAFKRIDWGKGILKSDWVGFSNFSYLFSSDEAWTMTRNTIGYNILFIVIGTVVAIMVAIFMNEITSKFANRIYQTLILLPYMISWVVCGYLVNALLSSETGLINLGILSKLGIEPIVWYQEKKYWPFIILLVYIWKNIGFSMVIYLASIVGISKEYYEAAKIDGCPNLVFIVRILIPLTKSAIGAMAVYTFINAYNMYMWPLLVTGTEEMRTVQIGISMLNSVDSQSITMVIAGVVMVILPSLFVFILGQKQLIRGMFSGAVKG